MRLLYRILFGLGIKPWERMASLPIAEQVTGFFDSEERERGGRCGRALDLGCGGGIWSVKLAKRGWDVTGVDLVPKALSAARERARQAGVDVRFVQGDLTALKADEVGDDFDLFLDLGAVHGMTRADQAAVSRGITALAAERATLIMLAFEPARRWILPRGMSRAEIEATYPEWQIVDTIAQDPVGAPGIIRRARPQWYRLRRG